MLDIGVRFNIKSANLDGARLCNLREIVSHQVDQHPVFGAFLFVGHHRFSELSRFVQVVALGTRTLDRRGLQFVPLKTEQRFWG